MAKRRNKGDGGLIQRHDHPDCPPLINGERPDHTCRGRWVGTLDTIEAGRRKRKYVYGRTQKEARLKLDKAKREKAEGTLVVSSTTVEKWMAEWLRRKTQPPKPLKPQTWRSYDSKVRLYINPHLGRHRLTTLEGAHIDGMYDAMRSDGLAEATLRQTHAILNKALVDAIKRGILAVNPIDRSTAPGTEKARRTPLTTAEAKIVLAQTRSARWWLALFYGMRQGEALGLRWCDIDRSAGVLRIQQTQQTDERYRVVFGTPKSAAGARVIPIVSDVRDVLEQYWRDAGSPIVNKPCVEVTGQCEHGLVFHNNGKPIQPKADNRAWHQLLADSTVVPWAPLPNVPLHAARNSAASLMEAAGIPDRLVAQILGQAQVSTTHGYQRAEIERMRTALEGVGRILELG